MRNGWLTALLVFFYAALATGVAVGGEGKPETSLIDMIPDSTGPVIAIVHGLTATTSALVSGLSHL